MKKFTKKRAENILNESGVPEDESRVPETHLKLYGTWLRKNDPEKFEKHYDDMKGVLEKIKNIIKK